MDDEKLYTNESIEGKNSNADIKEVQSSSATKKDDTVISFKVNKKHLIMASSIFIFIVLLGLTAFLGFNIGLENGKKIGLENGKKEGYSLGEKAASQLNTKEFNERYARGYVDSYVFNGIGAFDDVKSGFYVIKISELNKEPTVGLFSNVTIKDTAAGAAIKQPFYEITNLLNMGTGVDYFIKNNEIWHRDN